MKNVAYNASVWICLSNEEDCSRDMPRCGHMFHDKCIQTCKGRCKCEPNYGVGPTMQKALKEVALFSINRGGRSHAPMLRPCSSRELEHIGNAGIYSIHLIPSAKVPFLSSTFLKLSFYTWQPISSCLLPPWSLNYKRNPLYNTARARLARVWIYKGNPLKNFPSASIFKRNHFKNFFDIIFFTRKSLVKNLKITFNFTWKSY